MSALDYPKCFIVSFAILNSYRMDNCKNLALLKEQVKEYFNNLCAIKDVVLETKSEKDDCKLASCLS